MEIKTFRKKPVEIQAVKFEGGALNASYIIDWILANDSTARYVDAQFIETPEGFIAEAIREHIAIDTLEGTMRAAVGDWIIRGVQGEFYPCKPDIFKDTYEEV